MRTKKVCGYISLILFLIELFLIIISWIINVLKPELQVKSVLSPEGIRWFWGSFSYNLLTPILSWIILLGIAFGAFSSSGLPSTIKSLSKFKQMPYSKRHSLLTILGLLIVFILIIVLLAFIPHALLLGVTGSLYPSAFIYGLIPMIAIMIVILSICYGIGSGRFENIMDVFQGFYDGLKKIVPLFIVYIFIVQLYSVIKFVFF